MNQSFESNVTSRRNVNEDKNDRNKKSDDSLVNCDNKTNHCNLYLSDALLSGQNRSKLSIDDESSHPINGSSTNNKSERKRNINMVKDEATREGEGVEVEGDSTKRMKLDGTADGQDDNKSKMYQVSRRREKLSFFFSTCRLQKSFEAERCVRLEINFFDFSSHLCLRIYFCSSSFSHFSFRLRFISHGCFRRTAIYRRAKR